MLFDVAIIKDGWDFFNIIVMAGCSILSVILIFICSAMLSDIKKKYEQEFNALNYLVICINRYVKHLLGILSVINTKRKEINDYLASLSDETKFKTAFQIITPPMINFEVRLSDYAFTVKKQPKILDYLLNYIENYSLVQHQVDMINNDSYLISQKGVGSNESIQIAARYNKNSLEESNLLKLKFSICYTLSLLYFLLQTVQQYQNQHKYKGYTKIDFHESIMSKIIEAENFVTSFIRNENWKNEFWDENNFYKKESFRKNIFSITYENNHKVIIILGIKIKLKTEKNENSREDKVAENSQNNCDNCERKIKLLYEQFKNSAEDVGRYISIVCSIFYVSIITVYSQVANNLSILNKKIFIISFIISIVFFVLYEIFKMLLSYLEYKQKVEQWILLNKNEINISKLERNTNSYSTQLYKHHVTIWKVVFAITLISGAIAFISLLCGLCKL